MERLLNIILPIPETRIEITPDHSVVYIQPGREPFEVGVLTNQNIKGMECFAIMVDAPFIEVDSTGMETQASKVARAEAPFRKFMDILQPPRLITGDEFKEYFEEEIIPTP